MTASRGAQAAFLLDGTLLEIDPDADLRIPRTIVRALGDEVRELTLSELVDEAAAAHAARQVGHLR
jgi:hypothetical protein